MKPLNAIASGILNDVFKGRFTPGEYPISMAQIKDTIVDMRSRILGELSSKSYVERTGFFQDIKRVKITVVNSNSFKGNIPPIMQIQGIRPVEYARLAGTEILFEVLYLVKPLAGPPVFKPRNPVLYLNQDGSFESRNCKILPTDSIDFSVMLDDPRSVRSLGIDFDDDTTSFPMPRRFTDILAGKLTNDYRQQFGYLDRQPKQQQQEPAQQQTEQ